jgi:hypothetical protein
MAKNTNLPIAVSEEQEQAAIVAAADAYVGGQMSLTQQFENAGNAMYSSIVDDGSRESKIKIYNALTQSSGKLLKLAKEGKTIKVTDIMAHNIRLTDEETGEIADVTRVVLVTETGESYSATAKGVVGSVQQIVGIVGRAPWTPALEIKPMEVETRRAGFYTLTLQLV